MVTFTLDPLPLELAVTVTCDRCSWRKSIRRARAEQSIAGHYGYAHPERRRLEPHEMRALIR